MKTYMKKFFILIGLDKCSFQVIQYRRDVMQGPIWGRREGEGGLHTANIKNIGQPTVKLSLWQFNTSNHVIALPPSPLHL